ncbi:unnamed protein product [Adineta steineri]|uniref:NHL repeat containing protein n=1 Tax=Adineta steineri TaxID=433720 RepID=A0A815SZP2_9BILA|nr:unnamed protein product [Adineta steineri]
MLAMINNNRIGVDNDSETVTSNAARPKNLCEYVKSRKVMCITFIIIVLVIIITTAIAIVKTKKTNSEEISITEETTIETTEETATEITEKIEITIESPTTSTSTTTSTTPSRVIIDGLGQIYVADHLNDRVMRWCEGKEEGETVVGGNGRGSELNQLNGPVGLSFDDEGNLYVVDSRNHRIQKFETTL